MDQPIRGSCLCGGIRFEITGPPLWMAWCNYTRCGYELMDDLPQHPKQPPGFGGR